MKRLNVKGFGVVEGLLILVIVGLIGGVGYFVYNANKNADSGSDGTTIAKQDSSDSKSEESVKIINGVKYTVPSDWKNAKGPFKDDVVGSGEYLLSPDYKEAGSGQLHIEAGAYINFVKAEENEEFKLKSNTTIEQAVKILKDGEGLYSDPSSIKTVNVSDKQVIMLNSGHTTDGVTVYYKNSAEKWFTLDFSTLTGGDGNYNAQDSPHYKTFLVWLEGFLKLN